MFKHPHFDKRLCGGFFLWACAHVFTDTHIVAQGASTGCGGLNIAISLCERWDCKALYYHSSFWQNETLTNTTGFGDQSWGIQWDFRFYCFPDTSGLDWSGIANDFCVKTTFWSTSTLMIGCCYSSWRGKRAAMVLFCFALLCFLIVFYQPSSIAADRLTSWLRSCYNLRHDHWQNRVYCGGDDGGCTWALPVGWVLPGLHSPHEQVTGELECIWSLEGLEI